MGRRRVPAPPDRIRPLIAPGSLASPRAIEPRGGPLYRDPVRIVVVSGHYPPNFISGGSLQPQRIARALQARGHEVSVFAGWSEQGRMPPATWDDVDEVGLPVHWVATTPWEPWSEDGNW